MSSTAHQASAKIKYRFNYVAARVLGWKLRILPRRARLAVGRFAGGMLFALDAKHRGITLDNLELAFGSTKTAEEKRAIGRGAYRHFGAMLFELLSIGKPSWQRLERMVEFEGVDNFLEARRAGRGVILVSAHFGNWEVHAVCHGYRLGPITVVARPLDNPYYNGWLETIRKVSGNGVLYKKRALPRLMRLLKDRETVAILIDQNVPPGDGVFIDYFGQPAATTPVASMLAVKTGAVLVPVFTLPLADGRYRCIYEKPLDRSMYPGLDRRQMVQNLTQSCARTLEGYVRRNPEFWLWQHRRWKTRPAGELQEPLVVPAEEAG